MLHDAAFEALDLL